MYRLCNVLLCLCVGFLKCGVCNCGFCNVLLCVCVGFVMYCCVFPWLF